MRELAGDVRSPLFFAHIRAAIGTAAREINCRPFCHSRLLLMHSGCTDGLETVIRDLMLALDEWLRPETKGQTDNEVLFNLALMFRLEDDRRRGYQAGPPNGSSDSFKRSVTASRAKRGGCHLTGIALR